MSLKAKNMQLNTNNRNGSAKITTNVEKKVKQKIAKMSNDDTLTMEFVLKNRKLLTHIKNCKVKLSKSAKSNLIKKRTINEKSDNKKLKEKRTVTAKSSSKPSTPPSTPTTTTPTTNKKSTKPQKVNETQKKGSPTQQSPGRIFIRLPTSNRKTSKRQDKAAVINKKQLIKQFDRKLFRCQVHVKRLKKTNPLFTKKFNVNRKTVSFMETVEIFGESDIEYETDESGELDENGIIDSNRGSPRTSTPIIASNEKCSPRIESLSRNESKAKPRRSSTSERFDIDGDNSGVKEPPKNQSKGKTRRSSTSERFDIDGDNSGVKDSSKNQIKKSRRLSTIERNDNNDTDVDDKNEKIENDTKAAQNDRIIDDNDVETNQIPSSPIEKTDESSRMDVDGNCDDNSAEKDANEIQLNDSKNSEINVANRKNNSEEDEEKQEINDNLAKKNSKDSDPKMSKDLPKLSPQTNGNKNKTPSKEKDSFRKAIKKTEIEKTPATNLENSKLNDSADKKLTIKSKNSTINKNSSKQNNFVSPSTSTAVAAPEDLFDLLKSNKLPPTEEKSSISHETTIFTDDDDDTVNSLQAEKIIPSLEEDSELNENSNSDLNNDSRFSLNTFFKSFKDKIIPNRARKSFDNSKNDDLNRSKSENKNSSVSLFDESLTNTTGKEITTQ